MYQIFFVVSMVFLSFASAKAESTWEVSVDTILPRVFVIGAYEAVYDDLLNEYQLLLLTACDDDMDQAFDTWKSMLESLEAYADEVDFDIYGTKMWVNVFWNPDGTVRHFAYYLKPVSKNINTTELNLFLESFLRNYRLPFTHHEKFSHYGTAAFPLVPRVILRKRE